MNKGNNLVMLPLKDRAFLSAQLNRFGARAMNTVETFTIYSLLRIRGRLISFANQAAPLGSLER